MKDRTFFIHSSKDFPLYSHFSSAKTVSSILFCLSMVSHTPSYSIQPSIHLSLGLPFLRVPSGCHSRILCVSLLPGILFTCPNHRNRFCSMTYNIFFPTPITALMVSFRTFSFPILLFSIHVTLDIKIQ
jgi:hypothetical protein